MEGTSFLRGQPLTTVPSLPRKRFLLQGWKSNQIVRFSGLKNQSDSRKSRSFFDLSLRASDKGPIKASSAVTDASPTNSEFKEQDIVFVAGATGKVGSRTVRELLKLGFRVRAGVRSAQRAKGLVQSVKDMNTDEGTQPVEKLEVVECDLEKKDSIQPALGNASVVICCIGASEKEISDITGPYRIDYLATKNLVDAATSAKVNNFILVTSLGTNKFGFPAAILNLFWGVLCWKRKAEEALIASGLNYAIVRPGGMERPTDAYKETHNLTLALDDTLFGGQVSNLQVAELLACMAKNPQLSCSKIVEVVAETTAPLTPIEKLFEKIPSKRPYVPPPKESVAAKEVPPVPAEPVKQESVAAKVVTPVPAEPITKEPTAPKEDEAPAQVKEVKPRPLSPYAAYEDLKPPTSPIPATALGATKAKEVDATPVPEVEATQAPVEAANVAPPPENPVEVNVPVVEEVKQVEEKKERPLSPYASYENLKPPSSPTPKASGIQKSDTLAPIPTDSDTGESSTVATTVTEEAEAPPAIPKMRPLSPYAAYADLKPPTSPTPASTGPKKTAPAEEISELPGGNDVLQTVDGSVITTESASVPETETVNSVTDTSLTPEESAADQPKPRPLSPYTMYEDMKPPTSPLPSPVINH
ncbi:protein TIC 62, chloroplastic [Brassica rapa]|uniref:NAD(P)-binding domain-containing protein n=1 Tax=Brassica campestris TaxID=3711 RepID=M4E0S2_BRACM|nr:protein TIC 62, chloroplastic [Brassica rapa]